MSAPAPGRTPMMMPMMFPRICCLGYFLVSSIWPLRMLPNFRRGSAGGVGVTMARITSDTANMPTSAGMTSIPPSRSMIPNVKRGTPDGFSMPMQAIRSPTSMLAIALTGDDRATSVAHISPRKASQKYS